MAILHLPICPKESNKGKSQTTTAIKGSQTWLAGQKQQQVGIGGPDGSKQGKWSPTTRSS